MLILGLAHYLLLARHKELGSEARLPRQLLLLVLTLCSLVLLITMLPVSESTRNQVLGLFGVLLSGVIALSVAPFVTNFMATIMLRVTEPFRVGDFIRVGDVFGKVSERGIFDTEIQTENRELVAVPNATFINQSVTVVRSSGVIISSQLSLGYEIAFGEVEPLLLEAAGESGLSDPFVHVLALDDSAVQYRVAGLLTDVATIITARSRLNQQVLYTLHKAGMEIASPSITRHITYDEHARFLPQRQPEPALQEPGTGAESILFDKAREIEQLTLTRSDLKAQLDALGRDGNATQRAKTLQQQIDALQAKIQELQRKE